jgi:hypothetical protein
VHLVLRPDLGKQFTIEHRFQVLTNDLSQVRQKKQTVPGFELTNQNVFLISTRSSDLGDVSSESSFMRDHSVRLQDEGRCEEQGQSVYSDGVRNNSD